MGKYEPVVMTTLYSAEGLKLLEKQPRSDAERKLVFERPTVYVVNEQKQKQYNVYVGEANEIRQRTQQHLKDATDKLAELEDAEMYVIGDEKFHKSLTLDIENKFMEYFLTAEKVNLLNGRRNEQPDYDGKEHVAPLFETIIDQLHQKDQELFPKYSEYVNSALFKASPFKDLSAEQRQVKREILALVEATYAQKREHQLVTIQGGAGTGKSILMSSLLYDLASAKFGKQLVGRPLKVAFVVNHNEQVSLYQDLVQQLKATFAENTTVAKVTSFLKNYDPADPYDIVFVDEAHLVFTRQTQAWDGKSTALFGTKHQLHAITQMAKLTVAVFDDKQILRSDQAWLQDEIKAVTEGADERYKLHEQQRMNASQATEAWIEAFLAGELQPIPADHGYELRAFGDVSDMYDAIKAKDAQVGLSRLLATYDWQYKDGDHKKVGYPVTIGDFSLPWNYYNTKKRDIWSDNPLSLSEVGSTYTIQGFDLNYAGVILGPSIQYRDGKIVIDPSFSQDAKVPKTAKDADQAREYVRNALNVLMKRGVKGLYLYAVDDELREQFNKEF